MKQLYSYKNFVLLFLFISCAFFQTSAQEIPPRPNPPRLVTDFTGTLSETELSQLEHKLVAFNDSSSVQIAVVILSSLDGYPLSDYSFKLAEQWGIGQKGKNNGVLLLISMDERKMFIATGYGVEGVMPDAICRQIIENNIKPWFKQGEYYHGIEEGTTQMINLARGEYKPVSPQIRKGKRGLPIGKLFVVAVIILLVFLFRVRSVSRYSALNNIPFWAAWSLLNAARGRTRGSWGSFTSGSGGFGGGSGGGFGGFGGGSFGGGGAGGSW